MSKHKVKRITTSTINLDAAKGSTKDEDNSLPPVLNNNLNPGDFGLYRVGTGPQTEKNKVFFNENIKSDNRLRRRIALQKKDPKKAGGQSCAVKSFKSAKANRSSIRKITKSSKKLKTERNEKELAETVFDSGTDDGEEEADESNTVQQNKKIKKNAINHRLAQSDLQLSIEKELRLCNFLKLSGPFKWLIYEWFYSFIDKPLFQGENDFQLLVNEKFPHLNTRILTRTEWSKIRSKLGRPRRLSQVFLNEERDELTKMRQRIRTIQFSKSAILNSTHDLPNEIPAALPVGAKVTARLCKPTNGIFVGTVLAVNELTGAYQIEFDRQKLGVHWIQDYEIASNDAHEAISLSSLTYENKTLPKDVSDSGVSFQSQVTQNLNQLDYGLDQEICVIPHQNPSEYQHKTIGSFDMRLLELIIRTRKTLESKKIKIQHLRGLNDAAQNLSYFNEAYTVDFKRRYASIVISIDKLNQGLENNIKELYQNSLSIFEEADTKLIPSYLHQKFRERAQNTVKNIYANTIQDKNMLGLIIDLATVMYAVSHLNKENTKKVLEDCLKELRDRLHPSNIEAFHYCIAAKVYEIQDFLSRNGSANSTVSDNICLQLPSNIGSVP